MLIPACEPDCESKDRPKTRVKLHYLSHVLLENACCSLTVGFRYILPTTDTFMYLDPHHLVQMTSPVVSIYYQSIPGRELWNALQSWAHIVGIIYMFKRAEVEVGEGHRTCESLRRQNVRIMDIDHLMLSSFRCDFDDTAQYRVSAMNSKGELSAFASIVVKSRFHQVIKPSHPSALNMNKLSTTREL